MRPWLIAMLLLSAVLAGCSEGPANDSDANDADDPGDVHDDAHDDADGDDEEPAGGRANNTVPLANLTADVLNGTAPLPVNFTLTGSDADGDNLTWTLHLNGTQTANGTQLPSTVALNLTAGNHTVLLTVSDGNATANATLTLTVAEADLGPGVEPIFKVLEMMEGCWLCIDASLVPGVSAPGAEGCVGWKAGRNEVDCGWVAIPAEYQGLPYSVFSFTSGTLVPFGSDGHPDVEFFDQCRSGAKSIEQHWDQTGDTVIGVIPAGAGCIVGYEFHWPNVGHTIEFSLGAAAHA